MEYIFPKNIQNIRRYQKATNRHPKSVCESSKGKRDNEIGKDGRHEYDKGFGCDEVQEEPHYPGEEGEGCGAEVGEPVGDAREDYGYEDCLTVSELRGFESGERRETHRGKGGRL